MLCHHLLDGPIRVDYAEHGDMKILTEFFIHFPNLKASYDRRRKFYLHLFTSLYYVVRLALRNSHYYAENAV